MTNNNGDPLDPTLNAVAVIEAYMARDREKLDILLAPPTNHTKLLETLLLFIEQMLTQGSEGHPHYVLAKLREKLMRHIASRDTKADGSQEDEP